MSPTSCQTAPPRIGRGRILQTWQCDYNPDLPKSGDLPCVPGRIPRLACHQAVHGHVPVAGVAGIPVRYAAIGLDAQVIKALVQVGHGLVPRIPARQCRPVRQGPLPIVPELDFPGPAPLAAESALVNQAVVLAAQLHEVVEAGGATVGERDDVVDLEVVLGEALADGKHLEIRGFGTFKVTERKARMGTNPQTKERSGTSLATGTERL